MRNLSRLMGAVGMAALAMTGHAVAAEQSENGASQEQNSYGLQEIIVTARKVAENMQDVPVAITAFTGESLEKQNLQQVADLARFTPGLVMRQGSSSNSALTIALRGQVQVDILATLDPSVGTYVDGVYWARAYGLNASMMDVQSVQVLKGPQGTLFGRNTTGGALLIQSNDPDLNDASGSASVGYGRFDEWNLNGVINVPLVEDSVALRLAGSRQKRDGYTTNIVNGTKLDERDRYNLRAKLLVKPSERLSLLFSGEYYNADEAAFGKQLTMFPSAYTPNVSQGGNPTYAIASSAALHTGFSGCVAALQGSNPPAYCNNLSTTITELLQNQNVTPEALQIIGSGYARGAELAEYLRDNPSEVAHYWDPFVRAKTHSFGFTGTLDTDVGEVKFIAGYRKVKSDAGVDLAANGLPTHYTYGNQSLKQHSFELQWAGKTFDNQLDFVVGAFTFGESGFDSSTTLALIGINPLTNHFWGGIDNSSTGIYAQGTYYLSDQFSVTGGLRWSEDRKGLESRTNNYNTATQETVCSLVTGSETFTNPARTLPNGINLGVGEVVGPEICAVDRNDKFSAVSYTIGAEYRATDDIMLYLRHAKGYRAGGQNLRAPSTRFFIPFKPETAYSYEIGIKSELFDRRVRLNLSAYQTDVSDIQRTTLVGETVNGQTVTATILGNAGKARYRGVEADLTFAVTPELLLSASGSLTDPKYIRYSDLSGDRSQERFTGVAKEQFALAADYSKNIGDVGVNLHVDYSWIGKVPFSDYNDPMNPNNDAIMKATTTPATGLLGARASVSFNDGTYELSVYGRNITNNRKAASGLAVFPLGYLGITRQEPATYGVTGTVRF